MSDLTDQARAAQDAIGWANYDDPADLAEVMLGLAQVVMSVARAVEQLNTKLESLRYDLDELSN